MVVIFKLNHEHELFVVAEYDGFEVPGDGLVSYLHSIGEMDAIDEMEWVANGSLKTVLSNGEQIFAELQQN